VVDAERLLGENADLSRRLTEAVRPAHRRTKETTAAAATLRAALRLGAPPRRREPEPDQLSLDRLLYVAATSSGV
jgi:hypothetical protein